MLENKRARYHPLQVSFHWLVVVLLFVMFLLGKYMSGLPNDTGKIVPLAVHITLGVITAAILIIRFIARFRLPQPASAPTKSAVLDVIGKVVHYALYALVLLMVISGTSLSLRAGLIPIVFGGSSASLPADFFVYSARALHGLTARVLLVTVAVHVGAAFYHQLVLKDHILRRMAFEKKPAAGPVEKYDGQA